MPRCLAPADRGTTDAAERTTAAMTRGRGCATSGGIAVWPAACASTIARASSSSVGASNMVLQWQLDSEGRPDTRHDLRRQERVTAELEEVVRSADLLALEHIAPDRRQELLSARPRRHVGARGNGVRRRQRLAIDLAVRRQRQRVERDERRRHHVLGQLRRERDAQLRHRRHRAAGEVGDQALLSGHVFARHHHARADSATQRAAPPRSRRARSGIRGSSPGGRFVRGTPAPRRCASAPGRPSDTCACPARRRTDPARTARLSARPDCGTRAPPARRRGTARLPLPPAPGSALRRARTSSYSRSAGQSAPLRCRRRGTQVHAVTSTAASVGP